MTIGPQPGPQSAFLESPADIVVYGGAAGGGKSFALLLETLRHIHNPRFGAVIFRRTSPMITNEGGLWDTSMELYPLVGGRPKKQRLAWAFPSGARVKFAHLQHETTKYGWQGAQVALIAFDELTHFTEGQFFYLMGRGRSMSGVRPYVRAATNPDADSWVKALVGPWVDEDHPLYPTPSGAVRWFIREAGDLKWVPEGTPDAKSITFISARVSDNAILLAKNPEYLAALKALPLVEQERLLHGNWKIRPAAGKVFNRAWWSLVEAAPADGRTARFWDFAASLAKQKGDDPDWTAGVKMRRTGDRYTVLDVVHVRIGPAAVKELVKQTAAVDGTSVAVRWEQEGGSAGAMVASDLVAALAGFDARAIKPEGDKLTRAAGYAAQVLAGNVDLLRAPWVEPYLTELHHVPDWPHDDQMDASSGAFNELSNENLPFGWLRRDPTFRAAVVGQPGESPAPAAVQGRLAAWEAQQAEIARAAAEAAAKAGAPESESAG